MGLKTRAAIAPGLNERLIIDEVELRAPGPGEVLVEMKASGLCHTDLSVIEGKFPVQLPAILGHEGAGIVVECGPEVSDVAPGDHVILNNTFRCGKCRMCLSGKTGYCEEMAVEGRRASPFTWRGETLPTLMGSATFAAHTVIPQARLTRIDPAVPLASASLVPCGVMTGLGAAINVAKVEEGSSVLIIGLGSIGLSVLQACRMAGAKTIIAIDLNPAKEAVARSFGATHFINPADDQGPLHKRIRQIIGSLADYAFECVGHVALVRQALGLVNPHTGMAVAVGISPADQEISIPATSFYFGRSLRGTFIGDWDPRSGTNQIMDWYQSGELKIDELITHRLPLEEINAGFDLMKAGKPIRTVICY
jgi:S-(hydroxymethyl)glutathione dehydrogenase/alcohol dehydrogenase